MWVGVDICNTIANVNLQLIKCFGMEAYDKYPYSGIPQDYFSTNAGLLTLWQAEPFPKAVQTLNGLKNKGYKIAYVTSRSKLSRFITKRWLTIHRFPTGPVFFISQAEKGHFAVRKGMTMFFEDEPNTAQELLNLGIQVFLKDWQYNNQVCGENLVRFKSWRDISLSDWRINHDHSKK